MTENTPIPNQDQITLQSLWAIQILESAVNSDHGIIVEVKPTDVEDINNLARRGLQILNKYKPNVPGAENIQIRLDPDEPNTRLWLIIFSPDRLTKE
jgi:hypothetical protein